MKNKIFLGMFLLGVLIMGSSFVVAEEVTYEGVLKMLGNCEPISRTGLTEPEQISCNQLCNENPHRENSCVLSTHTFYNWEYYSDNIIRCNQSVSLGTFDRNGDFCAYPYENCTPVVDRSLHCLCCGLPEEENEATCTDSDGGLDYYTKGVVSIDGESYSDKCVYPYMEDDDEFDPSADKHLNEFICEGVSGYQSIYHQCPNGCQDGACVEESEIVSHVGVNDSKGIQITAQKQGWFARLIGRVIGNN